MNFKCSLCNFVSAENLTLMQHYVENHKSDPRFNVACGISGCDAKFQVWNDFKAHLEQNHSDIVCGPHSRSPQRDNSWRKIAHLLLGIRESDLMKQDKFAMIAGLTQALQQISTKTALENALEGIEELVGRDRPDLEARITSVFDEIKNSFKATYEALVPEAGMEEYLAGIGMVEPMALDQCYCDAREGRIVTCTGLTIPFLPTLAQLLSNHDMLASLAQVRSRSTNIKDVSDGEYVQENVVNKTSPEPLYVYLYIRDIVVTKSAPHGEANGESVTMFYWGLGNLPDACKSSPMGINLLAMVKTRDAKGYGYGKLLADFLAGMKQLEQPGGMELVINGELLRFCGLLTYVTANSAVARDLGGFMEGVEEAQKPCRSCLATKSEMCESFLESEFTLRNKQVHAQHVAEIKAQNAVSGDKASCGVRAASPLLQLANFDLPQCMVHDISCVVDVLRTECQVILKSFIEDKFFTLKVFNVQIKDFGRNYAGRPNEILDKDLNSNLGQEDSQIVCLANILPFLVCEYVVPHNNEKLLNFILLLQIVNVALADSIKKPELDMLASLIQKQRLTFRRLYPDVQITPEMHYLVHLPNQIKRFGPYHHAMSVRFKVIQERAQKLLHTNRSCDNVLTFLASRLQAKKFLDLDLGDPEAKVSHREVETDGEGEEVKLMKSPMYSKLKSLIPNVHKSTEISIENEMLYNGCCFKKDSIILLESVSSTLPKFGQIQKLVSFIPPLKGLKKRGLEKYFLFYKELKTEKFVPHLNSYQVGVQAASECVIQLKDLVHPRDLSLRKIFNCDLMYVTLLYHPRVEALA